MKPRKYEQGWERDDRIADFPEWVEEAEYETEMYRKHGPKRRPEEPLFEIEEGIPDPSTHEIHQCEIECPKCGQKINIPYAVRRPEDDNGIRGLRAGTVQQDIG